MEMRRQSKKGNGKIVLGNSNLSSVDATPFGDAAPEDKANRMIVLAERNLASVDAAVPVVVVKPSTNALEDKMRTTVGTALHKVSRLVGSLEGSLSVLGKSRVVWSISQVHCSMRRQSTRQVKSCS